MRNIIRLSVASLCILGTTGCTVYTYPTPISTGYGYTYFPRNYYAYQSYPLYYPYYPYGYPYYINRPIYWRNQNWALRPYYRGNDWRRPYAW